VLLYVLCSVISLAPGLTGAEVLQRCEHAYKSMKSLDVMVTAVDRKAHTSAHVQFVRSGKLAVSGTAVTGKPYRLVSNGKTTWVLKKGKWSKLPNAEFGIATITGPSGTTGTVIPALLLQTDWGNLDTILTERIAIGTATIGGRKCYRLSAKLGPSESVFVDASTYYLVRTRSAPSGESITVDFGKHKVNVPIPDAAFRR
jgi:outer membrane lipoprotein-sorting protein